jgi:hypothetical protein
MTILKFSIRCAAWRDISRYMPWIRKVWIFGDRPWFLSNDSAIIEHVPHEYVARAGLYCVPITNFFLMFQLSSMIPGLSSEYLWFCDDFIVLDDVTPEQCRRDRFVEDMDRVQDRGMGLWRESLWRTYDILKMWFFWVWSGWLERSVFWKKKVF